MWQNGTDIGLLADYKKRHRVVEVESRVEEEAEEPLRNQQKTLSPKNKWTFWQFLRRILGRRRRAKNNPNLTDYSHLQYTL